MTSKTAGAYGAADDLVDYILGITFEIWEQRRIDLIGQYYAPDTVVFSLEGITRGAQAMIDGTRAVLAAFPDRLLLGDDVIGKGDGHSGYSSHRVLSPMTNDGDTMFGPATGKSVRIMNMADCVIEEGVITREWLVRDNLALVRQLGFDTRASAERIAARRTPELIAWFDEERKRLDDWGKPPPTGTLAAVGIDPQSFSAELHRALWETGTATALDAAYAPYAVLHRSPIEIASGRAAVSDHYRQLRAAFGHAHGSIDHIATQTTGHNAMQIATRWTVAARHTGEYLGVAATGKPVYILGVTHRRFIDGRIAVEWTVFDSLAVLAQLL